MPSTYILDKPLVLSENSDYLGTRPYVNILSKLIEEQEGPLTIGLFGPWGSGKSSILHTLQSRLKANHQHPVAFYQYNAWKYTADSFRRTFIVDFVKHFELETSDQFKRIYQSNSTTKTGRMDISEKAWGLLPLLILWLTLTILLIFEESESKDFLAISGIIISATISIFKSSFVDRKIINSQAVIREPELFDEILQEATRALISTDFKKGNWIIGTNKKRFLFDRILYKTRSHRPRHQKIIVAIDNIDRCHTSMIVETLITIKNFLEKNQVIFLIPLDDSSIRNFLDPTVGDSKEFLRKIFDVPLRIKHYSTIELESYVKKLCKDNEFKIGDKAIELICSSYIKHPRGIKQFLNIIKSELHLVQEQKERGNIPSGALTQNVPGLVKLLILREEWPEFYNYLSEDASNYDIISKFIESAPGTPEEFQEYYSKKNFLNIERKHFSFLKNTVDISLDGLDIFFMNKDPFRGTFTEVWPMLLENDWSRIKRLIESRRLSIKKLMDYCLKSLERSDEESKFFDGFKILTICIEIINHDPLRSKIEDKRGLKIQILKIIEIIEEKYRMIPLVNHKKLLFAAAWLQRKIFYKGLKEGIEKSLNEHFDPDLVRAYLYTFKNSEIDFYLPKFVLYMIERNNRVYDLEEENEYMDYSIILIDPYLFPRIFGVNILDSLEDNHQYKPNISFLDLYEVFKKEANKDIRFLKHLIAELEFLRFSSNPDLVLPWIRCIHYLVEDLNNVIVGERFFQEYTRPVRNLVNHCSELIAAADDGHKGLERVYHNLKRELEYLIPN